MEIKQGTIMLYYCYDVADEIKLKEVETLLGKKPEVSKLISERVPSYVQYRVSPLLVRIGEQEIKLGDTSLKITAEAKLYHFGVVTIRFWMPFTGSIKDLGKFVAQLTGKQEIEKAARSQLKGIILETKDAMIKPHKPKFWEDYIVTSVTKLDRQISGMELLKRNRNDLASILCCDSSALSEQEISDALQTPLSYYEDELVLIDWDAAFIYNPRSGYDVADVIEFALISSLELRMYDHILDHALDKAYDDIATGEKKTFSLSPFSKAIKSLSEIKLDVSEMMEKIEHALKIVGDIYLAKVYTAAAQRFWLEKWKSSVKEKLETMENIYEMLHSRTNARLLTILEASIVVLIVFEILLFLPWAK